jgi:hypothetical protein
VRASWASSLIWRLLQSRRGSGPFATRFSRSRGPVAADRASCVERSGARARAPDERRKLQEDVLAERRRCVCVAVGSVAMRTSRRIIAEGASLGRRWYGSAGRAAETWVDGPVAA